jgi:hypothetical protein
VAVKLKEKKGRWWLFVDWHGQRKKKCFQTKDAAEAVRIALEARLALGADVIFQPHKKPVPPPPPLLLGDYFRTWLETYVAHACKESTHAIYEKALRVYIEPVLGKTPVAELTRQAIIEKLIHPLLRTTHRLKRSHQRRVASGAGDVRRAGR